MIDLTDHESGARYGKHYKRDLKRLQERLERIHVAHIEHDAHAVIMLEGWDAAGKGGIIERMTAGWDQRHFEVYPIGAPTPEEKRHDYLWRFRIHLPPAREITVFDRSWYGRVLVERVEGFAKPAEWRRAYDEINAFEAEIQAMGITLVKLFVHITQDEQDKRLATRLDDPWKRWKTGVEDYRNRAKRADYLAAMHEMLAKTDTANAPWSVVDGNNKKAARIAALSHVADRLEDAVDVTPPPRNPVVVALANDAFGYVAKD